MNVFLRRTAALAALLVATFVSTGAALAQAPCANRGLLDARYCDENGDLVADLPKDPKAWQNPATLVFSYTPVEDPAVYENVFVDFLEHLAKVTGKRVRWFPAESYAAQVEALRSGRLHIAGVATGPTPYAVNLAGFEPIVSMQRPGGGHRLHAAAHHLQGQPDQDGGRPQGQARRARRAVVELRRHRAARAVLRDGRGARQGLRGAVFRQARQLGDGRGQQGLRRRAGGLDRRRAHAGARHVQARCAAHRLRVGAVPAHRVRHRAQPRAGAQGQDPRGLPLLRLQEVQARHRVQGHRALRQRSATRTPGATCCRSRRRAGSPTRRKACPSSATRPSDAMAAVAAGSRALAEAAAPLLAIDGLAKIYPGGTQALSGVSFTVERPEVVAVIGSLRRRQEHADPLHQPAGGADCRQHPAGRHRDRRAAARGNCAPRAGASG